ncbi:MAG: M18 family aminopeptidase [bacterium]|nr:M18 family aminopeptidase [bacterium]
MTDPAADLLTFIDRSPTPYHAVAESLRWLEADGFEPLDEGEVWRLAPGDARTVVRGDGSLLAFRVGGMSPALGGFRIVGAHTDSPNLRVKPLPDQGSEGYRQLAVEPYGGVLLHSWFDRDLSLAGRVSFEREGRLYSARIDFDRPLLRIPNLAIHLYRELNRDGFKADAQKHTVPVVGLESAPELAELVMLELGRSGEGDLQPSDLRGWDLMTVDCQPSAFAGSGEEFVVASRLDNLASCHAGLAALLAASSSAIPAATCVAVLYDHEEVGSRSAQGAGGTFLSDVLERIVSGFEKPEAQGMARAAARSTLISADMAHAVHPNYADRHEPGHRPRLGGGPVIKVNAGQSYASDARTVGLFTSLCRQVGVEPQHFVTRNDLRCGSTIGPISAARVGIPAVDVGNPMLSMHSCREMAGRADVAPMIEVLTAFYCGTLEG